MLTMVKKVIRRGRLHNLTIVHENHFMPYLTGKPHFMGNHDHRHAVFGQLNHDLQHLVDHFRVESGGRFIKQHRDRVHRQRPADGDSLLLPTRELRREFVRLIHQTHSFEKRPRLLGGLAVSAAQNLQLRELDVVDDRDVGKEFEVLKHHADVGPEFR